MHVIIPFSYYLLAEGFCNMFLCFAAGNMVPQGTIGYLVQSDITPDGEDELSLQSDVRYRTYETCDGLPLVILLTSLVTWYKF